jgi:aspartyl/asparaginyl beta-hydroxylase (cupin superfamily)
MIALYIAGSLVVLAVVVYLLEPFLYAFLFSKLVQLFVRNPPFLEVDRAFPEARLLRENWQVIREEARALLKNAEAIPQFHEVDRLQRFISARDKVAWRTFFFKGFDKWLPQNCARAPRTAELLRRLPLISTAMFSIIDGGKHIPLHVGFFKSVLRYHLALVVPADAPVYIVVGGQEYRWREGEDVLFDDTYPHEVWNRSAHRRVVLFCDVLRDQTLPPLLRALNRLMFRLLSRSRKLQRAARRAEVASDFQSSDFQSSDFQSSDLRSSDLGSGGNR